MGPKLRDVIRSPYVLGDTTEDSNEVFSYVNGFY